MKKFYTTLILSIIVLITLTVFGLSKNVQAAEQAVSGAKTTINILDNSANYKPLVDWPGIDKTASGTISISLTSFLRILFNLMIGIAVLMAVIFIFWGGFQYATLESLSGKASAKKTIENALYGLGMALASWLLLYTINPKLISLEVSSITQTGTSKLSNGFGNYTAYDAAMLKSAAETQVKAFKDLGVAEKAAKDNQTKLDELDSDIAALEELTEEELTNELKEEIAQKKYDRLKLSTDQTELDKVVSTKKEEAFTSKVQGLLVNMQTTFNKAGMNSDIYKDKETYEKFQESYNASFATLSDANIDSQLADAITMAGGEKAAESNPAIINLRQNILAYKASKDLALTAGAASLSATDVQNQYSGVKTSMNDDEHSVFKTLWVATGLSSEDDNYNKLSDDYVKSAVKTWQLAKDVEKTNPQLANDLRNRVKASNAHVFKTITTTPDNQTQSAQ